MPSTESPRLKRCRGSSTACWPRGTRARTIRRYGSRFRRSGFDADRDILAHLGAHCHAQRPAAPLHIPLAMTTLTEIRDEPAQVSRAIDALCEAWRVQQKFERAKSAEFGRRTTALDDHRPRHHRDRYMKFGLFAGPAWVVTDRYLITSWSSEALRAYLDKVGERAGRRPR